MAKIELIKTVAAEVDDNVVALSEEILALAKSGELAGFAVTLLNKNGTSMSRSTKTMEYHRLVAGVAHLFHDVLHNHDS